MALAAQFLLPLFFTPYARADIYQWEDRRGVIHITDDINKVPDAYRGKARVIKEGPKEKSVERAAPPAQTVEPQPPADRGAELYGDETLEWWRQTFARRLDEVRMLETTVTAKRQFMDVFESGRRFGQTFNTSEVETYNRYRKELPEDQERLSSQKDQLDELRRKARIAGVPRDIRGE